MKKILKATKFGLHKLKSFFNIKQFIGSGVNLTPASRRRVKNFGKSSHGRTQGLLKIFRAPYRAHRAVIFATAPLFVISPIWRSRILNLLFFLLLLLLGRR